MTARIALRQRRQITLPQTLLNTAGVSVGDAFIAETKGKTIILKPQKQASLDAFKALQKAFAESGIPEKEMQDNLKKIRREMYLEHYGKSISR